MPTPYTPVILESPFAAATPTQVTRHVTYARTAVRDCVLWRHESPYASHLMIAAGEDAPLDDTDPYERRAGIEAGLVWGNIGGMRLKAAVYLNYGFSSGMMKGMCAALRRGSPISLRWWDDMSQARTSPALCLPFTRCEDLRGVLARLGYQAPESYYNSLHEAMKDAATPT